MENKNQVSDSIELLKKYYPVDEENKIITFKLYYQQASEVLDYTVGETGKEMFNVEFLSKVSTLLSNIPIGYKADIILEIADYDVYNEKIIMEKFDDLVELNSYEASRVSKKNSFLASILILIGCALLIVNALMSTYGILDSDTLLANVFKETLDITSWVFVWQAVTILFLTPGEKKQYIINIFYKLNSFAVANNGEVKIKESAESISLKCHIDTSFSKFQKQILAITSTLLIFESVVMIIGCLSNGDLSKLSDHDRHQKVYELVLSFCTLFDGGLALTKFTNHYVGKVKYALACLVTYLILLVYIIHNFVVFHSLSIMINQIFLIILVTISFIICFIWDKLKFSDKKNKQKNN